MPRLPGGPAKGLPACPRPGHEGFRVVKDGRYGTPARQRFRCTSPSGDFHRFTPSLPRTVVAPGVCDDCDNTVAPHQGPVASRRYGVPLREVSAALVAVGSGSTYTRAADRARALGGRRRVAADRGGQLVAEWLDTLGPHVLAPYKETEWPDALVLDSTSFKDTNRVTGVQTLAFNVLAAYGYPARGTGRQRLWLLRSFHRATQREWATFLQSWPTDTPPRVVVYDGDDAIAKGVRAVWPIQPGPSFPQPYLYVCEWHLRRRIVKALTSDGVLLPGSPIEARLDTAFRRSEAWEEFTDATAGLPATTRWLARFGPEIAQQIAVRHLLPWPHATGALDTPLGRVRDFLDSRSFVLRNQRRLDVTLGLMRLHLNSVDSERDYRKHLRRALDQRAGVPPAQRRHYDAKGAPSLRQ